MRKAIVIFYVFCVLAATAAAFGFVETTAFADVCFGSCGDPI